MNALERLLDQADTILRSGNIIPFDLALRLMEQGVIVSELKPTSNHSTKGTNDGSAY